MTEKTAATEGQQDKRGSTVGPKNRPWDRPQIELAMDVRSYERVVLLKDPTSEYEYPEHWVQARGLNDMYIDAETVVVFDRTDVTQKQLVACALGEARMVAICPMDVPHEKQVRRMLSILYPWTHVHDASTSFGKVLMCSPKGQPYDRDRITDDRPQVS